MCMKAKKITLDALRAFGKLKAVKGIDYRKRTASRIHFVNDLNLYVGKVFHIGNTKLAKNIAIFSLKEIFTCLDCKDCLKDCYAVKASKAYPTVNNHRWLITYMAINHLDILKSWIYEELYKIAKNRKYVKYVRIHESGDFFNQDYLDMWYNVASMFPNFKFYFYTKSDKFLDFSKFVSLPNVNMVSSFLPDGSINFDDEPIITKKCHDMGVPLCPYGVNGDYNVHCGECAICMRSSCVGFIKH